MTIELEDAIKAVEGTKGIVSDIARNLNCSSRHVRRLMNKWSTLAEVVLDAREDRTDWVESKLDQQIEQGNITAIIFYLKTQGKDRGYVEKQEVSLLVERELEKALDVLHKKLDDDIYSSVLAALASADS